MADADITKRCTRCGENKSISKFTFRSETGSYRSHCKTCCAIAEKSWRERNTHRTQYNKEYQTIWRDKNRDLIRELGRSHYRRNKEKYKAKSMNRRARKALAGGKVAADDIAFLIVKQKRRCAVCAADLGKIFHRDHIVALSRGGSGDITNIQLLCAPCNLTKGARDNVEFMWSRGFLI